MIMDNEKTIRIKNLILEIGMALIIVVLIIIWILLVPRRFDSPSTVINAMAMDLNYIEMSYNEFTQKLIVIGENNKQVEFKFCEEDWAYLQSRLIEENKDWGGWTFEHKEMPAGEGYEEHMVYYGSRKSER